jgi:hypothetical protein
MIASKCLLPGAKGTDHSVPSMVALMLDGWPVRVLVTYWAEVMFMVFMVGPLQFRI